jgi:RNA polymerase sigma factor (sigma-70 family)
MREGERERRRRFEVLFASYSSDIVAYCGWRADSMSDAQDAVAEVFLTAWRRLDELPDGDAARVWLYATARRVISNQRRSSRRRVALYERLALDAASVVQEPPPSDREETLVHEALRRLGPRDREILLLAEWEGLSPAQIAVVLGCRAMTARGRLHRGRRRFARSSRTWLPGTTANSRGARPRGRQRLLPTPSSHCHEAAPRTTTAVSRRRIMNTSGSFQALRRANPRAKAGFAESVEGAAEALHAQIVTAASDVGMEAGARGPRTGHSLPRRRLVRASTVGTLLAVAAAVAAVLSIGSSGVGPGVANAAAAVKEAATVTAASAERSGTAVVRITHNGEVWAGTTIHWHDQDVAVSRELPRRPGKAGSKFLVADGTLYGVDPAGGWVVLGNPENIDPGSGTTPDEYLAAVREDIGGVTCAGSATA